MPLIRLNRSLHPALPALWWARFLSAGCSVSALSDSVPLPGCKLFVDLFAGASAPLSAAIAALGLARLEPLDKLHGCGFDLLDDVQFPRLCALACSGIVGAAAAAPPCAPFSRARLRPGGPKPVRTPDFPTGIPDPSPAQQSELSTSALLHERARHFLSLVAAHGGLIILENPSSSILWLDPAVRSWLAVHAPYCAHVAACQYGLALPKAWAFWANFSVLATVACKCPHPPRFHPPFAGRRNADGSFATRQTACYPDALAAAIAAQIAPFLSVRSAAVAFGEWPSLLQPSFIWPQPSGRIQDGAGTCSSAFWGTPREPDVLKPLRSAWCSRLQTPGLLPGLLAHLVSPSKEPPLSKSALEPFLADLRLFYVTPHGPNSCTLIRDSVPLGIGEPIPPCKVLFPPDPPSESVLPLQHCDLAWKSALDHADLVDGLLDAELQEGWIRPVPGGDAALRQLYQRTAVGKLGVVVSPDRPPRLVVDSSVSEVTSNTCLPNKEKLAALVLDVSKAHRRIRIRPQDQGFYWNHLAGLLVRLTHRLWHVRHSAQIYVDDLLTILLRSSAPLLAAVLVVLLSVLRVPMSWHKAELSARVTWIGWAFDFDHFVVQLDPAKLARLLALLRQLQSSPKCTVTILEKLTGKLLWLSNLFSALRPSLAPLYIDQHSPVPNMCAISPELWASFRASLSPELRVVRPLPLAAIPVGCKLLRYSHTPASALADLPEVISSRRVWVQVANPFAR
ncbi:unnamed protein product, partial [Symbiodinium pilosum]